MFQVGVWSDFRDSDQGSWLTHNGLLIVLYILGAVILSRFVSWVAQRVTTRIDKKFSESDALVRSEAEKHNHAVAQVISWGIIALIYIVVSVYIVELIGIPITGLVAPATVLGAALGFGAQRIVQDLLSGFFIITERQYGFGDVVRLAVLGSTVDAEGTVEDVTLRVTKLRSSDGEVITIPNGQIVKATNLSKDWARAVVDIPLAASVDMNRVNELLHTVGDQAFADKKLHPLLLDAPTVMGVVSIEVDQVILRMVARTLPGKQFEVSRALRSRVVAVLDQVGITVEAEDHQQTLGTGGKIEGETNV
ncbi:MAG: mechanosensitive ion channel family protein [Mycobacteriaceae bacterium]